MVNFSAKIKVSFEIDDLLAKVDAMSAYDPPEENEFTTLAKEVGAIKLHENVEGSCWYRDGQMVCRVTPTGDLARLIEAFDRVAS